jgi:membrane protease YdiL (CAAX protease family)
MKKTLTEFCAFLKRPSVLKLNKENATLKRDFLWLLLLDIAVTIFIAVTYHFLVEFKLIKEYHPKSDLIKEYGIYWALIFACVIAPLLEESIFRWHLRKRYATIYFVLMSISFTIISKLTSTWLSFLVFFVCLAIAIVIELYLRKQTQNKKTILLRRVYPFVFYFSAIVFGVTHIDNFEGLSFEDPAFVIFICSQTFGGLTLGYIRIKYGLQYSMLSHAAFNLFAVSMAILFPNF